VVANRPRQFLIVVEKPATKKFLDRSADVDEVFAFASHTATLDDCVPLRQRCAGSQAASRMAQGRENETEIGIERFGGGHRLTEGLIVDLGRALVEDDNLDRERTRKYRIFQSRRRTISFLRHAFHRRRRASLFLLLHVRTEDDWWI